MLKYIFRSMLFLWGLSFYTLLSAQTDTACVPSNDAVAQGETVINYGSFTNSFSFQNQGSASAGQPVVGRSLNEESQGDFGFWSIFLLPPQAPVVQVTQGDFPDRVELSWEMDALSSEATGGFVVERDGSFLAELNDETFQFIDFNVQAGEFYEYGVIARNNFGKGTPGKAVGFVNPNGVASGRVNTRNGNPVVGAVVTLEPTVGTALSFDGVGDYLCVSYHENLPTDMLTVSAWVKIADGHNKEGIIDFGSDLNKNYWMHTTPASKGKGVVVGIGNGSAAQEIEFEFDDHPDDWHQVAMVYGGGVLLLYVDGQFKKSMKATISNENARFTIGSRRDQTKFYKGELDDVRVFNRLLSQTDILLTKNITVPSDYEGLVAYWKFDEGLGTKVFDLSQNGMDALLLDTGTAFADQGATFTSNTPAILNAGISNNGGYYTIEGINYSSEQSFTAKPSKVFYQNYAVEFNAAYTAYAPLTAFDLSDTATVEITVQPFDLVSKQTLLSNGTDNFVLFLENGRYQLTINGETKDVEAAAATYQKLALVMDGAANQVNFYINGELKRALSYGNITGDWSANQWVLGATNPNAPSNYYTGLIDEVAFYNTTLTLQRLQLNASLAETGGTDVGSPHLQNYFSLNEGEGTQLEDFGSARTGLGTLENASFSIIGYRQAENPHEFEPNLRKVNINASNTAVSEVNFVDISTVAITGVVRFEDRFCYQDSVEILVNGVSAVPQIFTQEDGTFSADFEPGASVQLTPKFGDHTFLPGFFEIRRLNRPVAGVLFQNQTKRKIVGQVFGGHCRKSIIPTNEMGELTANVRVKVRAANGCFEETIKLDNAAGNFVFTNLPPVKVTVAVIEHSNSAIEQSFQLSGGTAINLKNIETDTVAFQYTSGPNVEIGEVNTFVALGDCPDGPSIPIIRESNDARVVSDTLLKIYENEISVFQQYTGGECYLDTFKLTINNNIQESPQQVITSDSSVYVYQYYAKKPNIIAPYEKSMQVVAEVEGATSSANFKAVVLGKRRKEATISTRSPSQIFAILHDPPGDGSFATWNKGEGRCEKWNNVKMTDVGLGGEVELDMGAEITTFVGAGVGAFGGTIVTNEIRAEAGLAADFSVNTTDTESGEFCWQFNREISTSASDDIWGQHADVYFGAAMNFEVGSNDILDYDPVNCRFIDSVAFQINPANDFATEFVFTEFQILTKVIPDLLATQNPQDSVDAARWAREVVKNRARTLAMNATNPLANDAQDEALLGQASGLLLGALGTLTDVDPTGLSGKVLDGVTSTIDGIVGGFTDAMLDIGVDPNPIPTQQNITFDAGATYTQTMTTSNTSSQSFSWTPSFEGETTSVLGGEFAGIGTTVTINKSLGFSLTQDEESEQTNEVTTSFTLADDDINDFYSIDIAFDPVYNTPMFALKGGESMCPWIPGTRNREEVFIQVENPTAINVPANTAAVFRLNIGSIGPNGTDGVVYEIGVEESGNPDGAIIRLDGHELTGSPVQFQFIGEEAVQRTLTVERINNNGEPFDFEGLELYFASVCQVEHAESVGYDPAGPPADDPNAGAFLIYDEYSLGSQLDLNENVGVAVATNAGTNINYYNRVYKNIQLDAHFIEPCSPIDIGNPKQNHVVLPGEEVLSITLNEYAINDPDLDLIRVQYRPVPGDGSWINIRELAKSEFATDPVFKIIEWDMMALKDGDYEIRAITQCMDVTLAPGISEVILLTKSTLPPVLFGTPEPADGVWAKGDEISITFNKDIRCDEIFQADGIGSNINNNNLGLYNTETGELIAATISCRANKIVIVPNIQTQFIENQLLRVKVDKIKDLTGNESEEIVWEFRSNQSSLNWEGLNIEESKEVGELHSVIREVSNQGATAVLYKIENIPSWLIVNPSQGTVQPGERIQVSFTFPSNLTINDYSTTVQLKTSEGNEPLEVMLRVRCPSPDWIFDRVNDFENTQNFTVQIDVFGEMSEDPTDMVGAFIDGELRGVANIQFIRPLDKYLAFLTVYGDEGPDVPIDLRIWDASNCTVYPETIEKFNYTQGEIIGRLGEPQVLTVENVVERKINLSKGWNWISVNVDLIDNSVTNVMQTARNPEGAFVKDSESFSEYVPAADIWAGGLENITYAPRYMYFSEKKDSLSLEGAPYPPTSSPIDIKKGWNWIGFVPQLGTSVDRALESLNPLNGDLIKSQRQFAQYIAGFGWLGDLNFMEPPKGYLLFISQAGTLEYPDVDVAESFAAGRSKDKTPWEIETALFQHSMNTVAIVRGVDGLKDGDEIGAFVGEELRGKGKAIYIEPMNAYMAFITSYANQDGEALSFAYYDGVKESILPLNEKLTFNADDRIGRITDPFIFTVGEEAEEVAVLTATNDIPNLDGLTIYPNPAQDQVFISFSMKATEEMQIQVTDMLGRVLEQQEVTVAAGVSTLRWNTNQLENGLYFLRFRNETGERTKKIMISRK